MAVTIAACTGQPAAPPDTRAADEAAIRAAVVQWSAAAQAKDAAKFASFYTEDATLMLKDSPDIAGMQAIREGLTGMMQASNFSLPFAADAVAVARSGDLAYETGHYSMIMSRPDGKPAPEKGRSPSKSGGAEQWLGEVGAARSGTARLRCSDEAGW